MNTKKIIIFSLALVALTAGITVLILKKIDKTPSYNFISLEKGDIREEVKSSGSVKAATDVKLFFERSGKISRVNVKVGDKVKAGQVLATLSSGDLSAQLSQAKAAYDAQISKMEELKRGARPEDVSLSQTQVDNAQKSVADAQSNLDNVKSKADLDLNNLYNRSNDLLNDAYAKASDALNIKINDLFSNPQSAYPKFNVQILNSESKSDLEYQLISAHQDLDAFKSQISGLSNDPVVINQALADNSRRLSNLNLFLKNVSSALNSAIISVNLSQATLVSYKTNVNLALNEVNASISSLNNQTQAIASQKTLNTNLITQANTQLDTANNNLASAVSQLNLKKAGATKEQLTTQQAYINQARASMESVSAQLAKMVLISPISGTVSEQNGHEGELSPTTAPIVSLISDAKFQIETQLTEKDIAKVKVGQPATVVLDAYGNGREFKAVVIAVDPASTIVDGSVVYKVTLELSDPDEGIKPGLTANIRILTNENKDALIIPESALIKEGLKNYVIVDNRTTGGEKREVEVGISSSDGRVEIKSGLESDDQIASFGQQK